MGLKRQENMFRLSAVLVLSMLAGCAFQILDEGLPYLMGKPIDEAVSVLGFPSSKLEMAGSTIYVWDNRYSAAVPIYGTTTTTTTGWVGTTPVYGTTSTPNVTYVPVQHQCQIKLSVDASGFINRWEYFGNQGGCQYYANGVKRLIPK